MSMGPFSINREGQKYLIKNQWGDLIRETWTLQEAHNWEDEWYRTRALEDKFLHTNIHVRLLTRKRKQDTTATRKRITAKAEKKRGNARITMITLSCGFELHLRKAP